MAARKKTTKKRAAKRVAPHPCKRCDGTGRFKNFGECYACDGTGTTTKQQRAGASKWRGSGGGTVASLCRARRTVSYLSDKGDTTLYCYNKEGHDTPHRFMLKVSERGANDCGKPVAADAYATFPCAHLKGHSGDCWVASNMQNSIVATITKTGREIRQTQDTLIGNHTARQLQEKLDAADAARATEATHEEPSAQPEAGWDITQRSDLDDLVDLFKE